MPEIPRSVIDSLRAKIKDFEKPKILVKSAYLNDGTALDQTVYSYTQNVEERHYQLVLHTKRKNKAIQNPQEDLRLPRSVPQSESKVDT